MLSIQENGLEFSIFNSIFGDNHLLFKSPNYAPLTLFDIGDIQAIPLSQLLKIRTICISHTHLDHFVGILPFFREFLRIYGKTSLTLTLIGPPNLYLQTCHLFRGFNWNLLDAHTIHLHIIEVHSKSTLTFPSAPFFQLDMLQKPLQTPFQDPLLSLGNTKLFAFTLDHHIPSIGYHIQALPTLSFHKETLLSLGYSKTPALRELKTLLQGFMLDKTLPPLVQSFIEQHLPQLLNIPVNTWLSVRKGESYYYLTDFGYTQENIYILEKNSEGENVNTLFIESHFMDSEALLAEKTKHLTLSQALSIGKKMNAKKIVCSHLSPRYKGKIPHFERTFAL